MIHLPEIFVQVIPHNEQLYDTVGNYIENNGMGVWDIEISEMSKWEYESLVLVHELVEMILTKHRKISWKSIDKFDMGLGKDLSEPGNDKRAPYFKEHQFATRIEKMLCNELGIDWNKYDKVISKLKWSPKSKRKN